MSRFGGRLKIAAEGEGRFRCWMETRQKIERRTATDRAATA